MARPLKYKTVDELQAAIDDYFDSCAGRPLLDDKGQPVLLKGLPVMLDVTPPTVTGLALALLKGLPVMLDVTPPTVTGLALALGFAGRQALLNYQGRKQFKDAITRAKSRCEAYAEGRLFDRDGAHGAQFSLRCNFGWSDKAEQAESGGVVIQDDIPD